MKARRGVQEWRIGGVGRSIHGELEGILVIQSQNKENRQVTDEEAVCDCKVSHVGRPGCECVHIITVQWPRDNLVVSQNRIAGTRHDASWVVRSAAVLLLFASIILPPQNISGKTMFLIQDYFLLLNYYKDTAFFSVVRVFHL